MNERPGTPLVDSTDLVLSIVSGDLDDDLAQIAEVVAERRKLIRKMDQNRMLATLKVGDRVKIVATARPQYIAGKPGTIVGRKGSKFVVDLDQAARRFHKGVRCPADMLEAM